MFEFSPQVALCYVAASRCQAKTRPLLSAAVKGEAVRVLSNDGEFELPESDTLKVLARARGDAVLTVKGELDDGTIVTRYINILVRRANRFEVSRLCSSFISGELLFLGGIALPLRPTLYRDAQVLEGEHPEALVAEGLTRAPDAFLDDWYTFSPGEGARLIEFRSALVTGFSVRGQIYTTNQLQISDFRSAGRDRVLEPNASVVIHARGLVDGLEACTLPSFEASVLTPTVCGDGPTVHFEPGFLATVRVLQTGTCELEFMDSQGVQRFAFDIVVQAP